MRPDDRRGMIIAGSIFGFYALFFVVVLVLSKRPDRVKVLGYVPSDESLIEDRVCADVLRLDGQPASVPLVPIGLRARHLELQQLLDDACTVLPPVKPSR